MTSHFQQMIKDHVIVQRKITKKKKEVANKDNIGLPPYKNKYKGRVVASECDQWKFTFDL